ncbi:MAG TPA: FAD-dependent oxidoreductase [bacterium]|nr:FAD-dependent oxidoreductase [bacterium]
MRRRRFCQVAALGTMGLTSADQAQAKAARQQVVIETRREIPVIDEADICILGGSCTGVFAAIRAARLGANVVLVEKQNCLGGVATSAMVNVWHSLYDTEFKRQIIAGLTLEAIERLQKRGAAESFDKSASKGCGFNSEELKIELDEMVSEAKVRVYFHTFFSAPVVEDGELSAVIVENKSGRAAIRAKVFVDATGDSDLCHRLKLPTYVRKNLQPPTACARFGAWSSLESVDVNKILAEHRDEFALPEGFIWGNRVPDSDVYMLAGTRVYDVDCSDAKELTHAEIEGRRQIRAIMDILRKYAPPNDISLQALPSQIGIRETRHVRCRYQLTGDDVLTGRRFDDAIANGSYRVDIHHQDKPGITLRYLDGREQYSRPGYSNEEGRWREKTDSNPTFYQIPFRCLVPEGPYGNLVVAGRMLDADEVAFSGVRVMVNMNQTGEAAGTAAWMALDQRVSIGQLHPTELRELLAKGGSLIV